MKNFVLMISLGLSLSAFSQTQVKEFDQNEELKCHSELKTLGCVNSNGEPNATCAEKQKTKMSRNCASLHEEKKSK